MLANHPNGLPLPEVRSWFKGIVEGVAYLHDHGIVHRDLKPANVFLEEGVVKIGDYGLSKLINVGQGSGHSESIGTCHYMAPEISTGKYHKPIDIYALGVILHEMLTGKTPFDGQTVGEVLMKHLTAKPDVSLLAEPYRSIVAKAMEKDPVKRQTSALEMLSAEDAPKSPTIRYIGQANAPSAPPASDKRAVKDDDVLRIGVEEPVFFIGPDTRPPGSKFVFQQWLWRNTQIQRTRLANLAALRRQRLAEQQERVEARNAQIRDKIVRAVARRQPPAPPDPPPLPPARARFAELVFSLLVSAFVVGALAFPVGALIFENGDPARQPERLAMLFVTSLLATWGVMIPNKIWEGRPASQTMQRIVMLFVGIVVGGATWETASLLNVGPEPGAFAEGSKMAMASHKILGQGMLLSTAFFGLTMAANGWRSATWRDRRGRFKFFQVAKASIVATVLAAITDYPLGWGVGAFAIASIASQATSPWSEAAAIAAKARRKFKRVA